MTEPDAYRDVDGFVFLNLRKHRKGVGEYADPSSAATPLWLTEAPDPAVIASVLDRHRLLKDGIYTEYFGPRLTWIKCSCGKWKSESTEGGREVAYSGPHRAHVAAAVCAALVQGETG